MVNIDRRRPKTKNICLMTVAALILFLILEGKGIRGDKNADTRLVFFPGDLGAL